ncbi:TPA: DUF3800 domain-containing protein [Stenotrophomonas maltophilia]|nr:DUF3800 domain-containing protein [Stenotrophomonas maltophilia]
MPNVLQADDYRAGMPVLRNWDLPIQLYYDETNNIRRLSLTELGLNSPDNKIFAIAGVALSQTQSIPCWEDLRKLLKVQPSAKELKFDLLAKGSYEDVLRSKRIESLLEWLLDQDIMIHYSVLDPLYWSTLDIIESLQVDDRIRIDAFHTDLKAELHHAVLQDVPAFMKLLHGFAYPNLDRGRVGEFLTAVADFVDDRVPEDRNIVTAMLRQTLKHAGRLPGLELPFLHDEAAGQLIKDFSVHFMHPIYVFKNASHVFDNEVHVERIMRDFELRDRDRRLNYRFADSKDEPGIQLSDAVAGLIGRHFSYLQAHSLTELMQRRVHFDGTQTRSLAMLRELIDRSDGFSEGLLHSVMPLDLLFKNEAYLHDAEVPLHIWN